VSTAENSGKIRFLRRRGWVASLAILTATLALILSGCVTAKPALESGTPYIGKSWGAAGGEPFRFALIGDKTGATPGDWPLFDQALQEINAWKPDFAVMIGDMIQGDSVDAGRIQEQWGEFNSHIRALEVPLFVIPGNHDISNPFMLEWWRATLGRTYYSFTYRDCLFIMLNTMEYWKDFAAYLGDEQIRYALDAIRKHPNVRHTFVFLHVPHWLDDTNAEWPILEQALASRPHTVFAGHIHRNTYEERNGGQYLVVTATKGDKPLVSPPKAPELGVFPAWAQISVEGSQAQLTLVEPGAGRTWPANIAPTANLKALRNLVTQEALMPEKVGDGIWKTGFVTTVVNQLPGVVKLQLAVQHPFGDAWKPISEKDAALSLEVLPGEKQAVVQTFHVPESQLTPAPRIATEVTYKEVSLYRQAERNVPVFPKEALRWPREWMVLASPYDSGDMSDVPSDDPRSEWPLLFVSHPAESGYKPDESLAENGRVLTWRALPVMEREDSAIVDLGPLSDLPLKVFTYASTYVYSPTARIAYAQFRVDDYGQILVNGKMIEDGRVFRTRRDPVFVALPLHEGWNNVTVKPINIVGGWTFRLLFADPEKDLRFANAPQ